MTNSMSPDWFEAVMAFNPRPHGPHTAVRAVLEWALATPRDTRIRFLTVSTDDEAGGHEVGRALKGGGWDGTGLEKLADMFAGERRSSMEPLMSAYLGRREDEKRKAT